MDRDALIGYTCWAIAAVLGSVVATIIIASLVSWAMH
jgi:hypothetical protein